MLEIGTVIDGTYKILNIIGQGGMSTVYLAMNERANKQWAIKEVRKDGIQNFEVVKQGLIVEMDMLKKLNHPNLPSIIDVIDGDGLFLIIMDYIEGNPLSSVLKEHKALPQENIVSWAKQVCDVLGYLHSQNPPIIYRDVKPANIMLKPNGDIMLIDFGTAREFKEYNVADTTCLGTRGYAAPEQFGGQGQTDVRTDIYCLGATMYHLVTGHNPCEPPYEMYPIRQWKQELSSGLEEIIATCVQKNPADRYQNCAELLYALEHYTELDIDYRRRQNRKWVSFITMILSTIILAIGAVGFGVAERNMQKNSYTQYLVDAKSMIDKTEQIQLYKDAIKLNAGRDDAYTGLLNHAFLDDNEFTQKEEEELRKVLGTVSGRIQTNESYLKADTAAYERFAYDAAMAYFYYFENSGNKSGSLKWLEIVSKAATLEEYKRERGKRLAKIAEYYSSIGVQSKTGDEQVTYKEYWDDLVELTQGNLVEMDNSKTAFIMYQEVLSQICDNCIRFKNAGVTSDEMLIQIQNIARRLETDILTDSGGGYDKFAEEVEKIRASIELAKGAYEVSYKEMK